MKIEQFKYFILCACLDDWEPLYTILSREQYLDGVHVVARLVNEGLLRCELNSSNIQSLSPDDIISNIKKCYYWNDFNIPFADLNWEWKESYIFKTTEIGNKFAMDLFETAKGNALNLLKKILDYHLEYKRYPSVENFNNWALGKPYLSFGNWVYLEKNNAFVVGFLDYDDADEYYGYDSSKDSWLWMSLHDENDG